MKLSKEVKTALLVISGIFLLIYGFNYLKGESIFTSQAVYYTEFDYNALSTSSSVTIRGNAVGKVSDIVYDFKTGKTKVYFTVDPELKFSRNSKIRLYETGLMGGNALAIIKANDTEFAKNGDFIESEIQPGLISSLKSNFTGLSSNLDSTLRSADTLLVSLNTLVTDTSDDGIKSTIAELNGTLIAVKDLAVSVQAMVDNNDQKLSKVIDNFNNTSENLATLSNDIKDIELSKTVAKLDETLATFNAILKDLDDGNGTVGKLLKDEALYANLDGATKELEELLRDIKLHPKRYFRILSKKEIPYTGNAESN
ncbi:MlaD family protein [Aestuariivivens sediminicola]|uniref:MlaD family protein n=1 Tax=Aestuariivivens sediminicola TaxID=2913560 RepID=UPI001F568A1E|nr:MlaD family protein [Aestuariivivens sediminicola]